VNKRGLVLLCVLASGCGFFGRSKNSFYSLETVSPQAAAATIGGTPIGVDGIELPPGVDRREIVSKGENHTFKVNGSNLWASPLEEMVIHTLAFDLAGRLPEGMVILPGQARPSAMRALYVTFEELTAHPNGEFVLDARWVVTAPGEPELAGRDRITIPTATDASQIVEAMSNALAQLADRIVAKL
jgi:uncharacterized lipoprotein YmbA